MPWKSFIPGSPEAESDKDRLKGGSYVDASGDVDYKVNPTNRQPWCVVVNDGVVRCYKGSVWGDDKDFETRKTHIRQIGTARSKIKIQGSRASGSAGDSIAAGGTSAGAQVAWPPQYDSAGGTQSKLRDPEPTDYGILCGTNGKLIGNGAFKTGNDSMPWFEWGQVEGKIWLKGNPDSNGKLQWGLFYESGSNQSAKYAFLVASIEADGTVLQYLKSDIFVPDPVVADISHPFKVRSVDGEITVEAGTLNNEIIDAGIYEGGGTTYVYLNQLYDVDTDQPDGSPTVGTYGSVKSCDDLNFWLLIAEVVDDEVHQFVTGSLWVDRMRMGDQPANYYVARI